MSLLDFIFSRRGKSKEAPKKTESSIVIPKAPTAEYARLLQFTQRLNSLLLEDRYLAPAIEFAPLGGQVSGPQ